MINPNDMHPLPRYGLATAVAQWLERHEEPPAMNTEEDYALLAKESLEHNRGQFMLKAEPAGVDADKRIFKSVKSEDLKPGKANGQVTATGYFTAPHVLTGNNAADLNKEMLNLIKELGSGKFKNYELKRSFAPLVSKINAGSSSMSNPKVDLLTAAFTAVAVSSPSKAAAFNYKEVSNVGVIPDLDYTGDHDSHPLLDYLYVLDKVTKGIGNDAAIGAYREKDKRYLRPPLFNGNFKHALRNVQLGSVGLLAAIGQWITENKDELPEDAALGEAVLEQLANRPIYLFGYQDNRQEQFGHHLVELSQDGYLYTLLKDNWKVEFYDIKSEKKYSDPKYKHFQRNLDHFLRFFTDASFKNFLATRATYPPSFFHLLNKYFMHSKIPQPIVDSAMEFGRSINMAAYYGAKEDLANDKKTDRDLGDYKHRILSSLEGNIRSAKTPDELLARISTILGRMTKRDITAKADVFMNGLLTQDIELDQGKNLLLAFMRLNQYKAKKSATEDVAENQEE